MSIKISVIVPVYEIAVYLPRCLASLEAQTAFAQAEIVLVDDGSGDGSGQICDAFAARHANARVIHKKNGGVSSARNAGLEAAAGAYIAFVDGDDFLRADALEVALDGFARGAQGVFFRYAEVSGDAEVFPKGARAETWLEGPQIPAALLRHSGVYENVFKAFDGALARGARFPEDLRYGEDAVYLYRVCAGMERAVVPPQAVYFYRQRPGSAMRTLSPEALDQRVRAHEEVERIVCRVWPELTGLARARALYMRIYVLNDMLEDERAGDKACLRRHVRALRGRLFALLRVRDARWMPPARKVYALLLALCPPLARRLHARRVSGRGGSER